MSVSSKSKKKTPAPNISRDQNRDPRLNRTHSPPPSTQTEESQEKNIHEERANKALDESIAHCRSRELSRTTEMHRRAAMVCSLDEDDVGNEEDPFYHRLLERGDESFKVLSGFLPADFEHIYSRLEEVRNSIMIKISILCSLCVIK